jgi:CHAD domain-containing protein
MSSPSRKYRLRDGHPLDEEIRRVAIGRADHALEALREDLAKEPEEAVHTARKDLKKLRSLLRLVRSGLGDDAYSSANDELRAAGQALGGIRDVDVMLETLEKVTEDSGELGEAPSVTALRSDLLDRRARAHHGAGPSRAAEEASSRIEAVAAGFPDWPDALPEALAPGLERAYRRGRKRMREAEGDPTTERLHEWRKRAKDHWYHLRVVRDAWPQELQARADEVHRLTDLVGDDHDLAILAGEVQSAGESSDDRADLLAAIDRRRADLQAEAFKLGARVYAEKPKAFARRMEALLGAWRGAAVAA